ncbi:MAG: S-formylglutathione hydrolase [Cyanobacteria bacterium P01_F01_bin.143]
MEFSSFLVKSHRYGKGHVRFYEHPSQSTKSPMRFSVFRPSGKGPFPGLLWLSGLTCTEENFITKSNALRFANKYGILLFAPDTSPRNTGIAGENEDWDFGSGAGFYVNAIKEPWNAHYQMYDYVARELPELILNEFPVKTQTLSISGHSMGGHGALVVGLRNPDLFTAISAFAPIANPIACPWGQKAFFGYLGEDKSLWQEYDAIYLLSRAQKQVPILIDQGSDDPFLAEQLLTPNLIVAVAELNYPAKIRIQEGFDHSYYFIATFIEEHLKWHFS